MTIPDISELVSAEPLENTFASALLALVLLLFGLVWLSSVSKVMNVSSEIVEAAKEKAYQPSMLKVAEDLQNNSKEVRSRNILKALPRLKAEAKKLVA